MRLLALVTVFTVLAPASAVTAAPIPQGRMGVGDSIMLSSADELRPLAYLVDAEVGRQFTTGIEIATRRAANGTLPRMVVVHLGTNGPIPADGCEQLLAAVGHRRVFLVTVKVPRPWETSNNELIRACAAASERVYIVRWYSRAIHHPEWLADDGYHLSAEGQAAYALLIDQVVDATVAALRAARGR